jgi:hypothetical protein
MRVAMPSKKLTRYPAVELLRFFDREMSSADIGDALGIDSTQVRRWRSRGITLSAFDADRYAMSIGLHPWMVWGDLWFAIERQETL